jgi:hypothetical protein
MDVVPLARCHDHDELSTIEELAITATATGNFIGGSNSFVVRCQSGPMRGG